uniref:Uncharacterized protein n=1 Tax=Heliothis virescens TaxID=7102 RepID=A0A2A4IZA3_HELVI
MSDQKKHQSPPVCCFSKSRRLLRSLAIKDLPQAGIFCCQSAEVPSPTESNSCSCGQIDCGPGICCSLHRQCFPIDEPLEQENTCAPQCKGHDDELIHSTSRDGSAGYPHDCSRNDKKVSIRDQGFDTSDLNPKCCKSTTTSMEGRSFTWPAFDSSTEPENFYCEGRDNPVSAAPKHNPITDVFSDCCKPPGIRPVNKPVFGPRNCNKPLPIVPKHNQPTDVVSECCKPSTPRTNPALDPRYAPKDHCCDTCKNPASAISKQNQTTDVASDCCNPASSYGRPVAMPALDPRDAPKDSCCDTCKNPISAIPKQNQTTEPIPDCCKPAPTCVHSKPGAKPKLTQIIPKQKTEYDDNCSQDTCGKDILDKIQSEGLITECSSKSQVWPKAKLWEMPLGTPPPPIKPKTATARSSPQKLPITVARSSSEKLPDKLNKNNIETISASENNKENKDMNKKQNKTNQIDSKKDLEVASDCSCVIVDIKKTDSKTDKTNMDGKRPSKDSKNSSTTVGTKRPSQENIKKRDSTNQAPSREGSKRLSQQSSRNNLNKSKDDLKNKKDKSKTTGSCGKPSCSVNTCTCRFPPAYSQYFDCTGRISGHCNCDQN